MIGSTEVEFRHLQFKKVHVIAHLIQNKASDRFKTGAFCHFTSPI